MRPIRINSMEFLLDEAELIETRTIGKTADGCFQETLIRTQDNHFLMIYYVLCKDVPKVRRKRIVNHGYVAARAWYELKHPKGSFHEKYKETWELF